MVTRRCLICYVCVLLSMQPSSRLSIIAQHVSPASSRSAPGNCVRPVGSSTPSEFEPRRVLFTGGAGFIGSNTLVGLVQKYPSVLYVCLDNLSIGSNLANLDPIKDAKNFKFVRGSITDEDLVRKIMVENELDTVMHFAAQTHVDRSFVEPVVFSESNVVGTAVLLKVARSVGARRFLHVSTDEVYGETAGGVVFTEDQPFHPGNPYSASKAAAEMLLRGNIESYGEELPIVIVRPNNIYGPRQYPEKLIPKFIMRFIRGDRLTLHGTGESRRSFLFVEDAIEAFDLVLRRGVPGRAYNIGAHETSTRSVRDVSMVLLSLLGVPAEEAPKYLEMVGDRAKNDCAYDIDGTRINQLGWVPRTTFEDGLRRTVDWYLGHKAHWTNIDDALLPHNGTA